MRHTARKKGRTATTPQEIRKKTGGGTNYSTGLGVQVIQKVYLTTDFSADTVQGEACFRLDVAHSIGRTSYIWNCFKSENNSPIIVMDWHQGEYTLKLWFYGNAENVTVNIVG